jgi:hypothetical protein
LVYCIRKSLATLNKCGRKLAPKLKTWIADSFEEISGVGVKFLFRLARRVQVFAATLKVVRECWELIRNFKELARNFSGTCWELFRNLLGTFKELVGNF